MLYEVITKMIGENIQEIVVCDNAGFIINLVFEIGGKELSSFFSNDSNFLKVRIPFNKRGRL